MEIIIQQIELLERMDRLIRLQATGSPEECASLLKVSKTKLYRVINLMKTLNAPIKYNTTIQSYIYIEPTDFKFGFYKNQIESLINKDMI